MAVQNHTGDVWISDFDRGVIETFGGYVEGSSYVVDVPDIDAPPGFAGVPIQFAMPDEAIDVKILPSFIVRRTEAVPALNRWHLGNEQYRQAAIGADQVTVVHPITGETIAVGWTSYETKPQAIPYDMLYTLEIRARYRNSPGGGALQMQKYLMKKYQPYTAVYVKDSNDAVRSYTAFTESHNPVDTKPDVAGKQHTVHVSLRIEGELDLNDPFISKALVALPTINMGLR